MISDVERRDAADFLRCYADKTGFKASCVIAATVGIKCEKTDDDAMCEECWAKAATRLADLIEPEPDRTCQDVEGGDFFRCSKCGCELMRVADGWRPLYMGEVNYCPNCGAKVTEP